MQASDVSGLVDRYGPEIYRYCRRLAGFAPDAEDLYQQTFLRLLELPQQLDEEQNPRALLYSVAGGIWKNEARKRGRRAAIAQPLELDAQDAPEPAAGDDTETAALGRADHAALRAAVDQLPLKYRVPALLAYGAELPLEAIAAIEKLPVGTVKSRLHRAKQMLRQEMEAQGYERQKI